MGRLALGTLLALTVCVAQPAHAGTIVLGDSGWEAIWDSSLDGLVDIAVDAVTDDAVFIEKSAQFLQGPNEAGLFPTIPIVFRQIAWPAVSQIIINDEIISNSTGSDWTGFRMELLDSGNATFNSASTFGSGFTTSPFSNQTFSDDLTVFNVDGGVVADGGIWFPGLTGDLYIDVVPSQQAPFTLFTLKETPVPEPATVVLLAIGACACIRRRRAA